MMVHSNVVLFAAVVVSALFGALSVTAYPTSMERVSGDNNNYQPLRNSASRDFDRFIDFLCADDAECGGMSSTMTANQGTLDRLNGGHIMAAKRDSLDRLNGGHIMSAKRDSLDRLNGGHVMAAKRDSLDRLNGGHVMAAKRDSLDRLNGGHVMAAKRDSLDRLNGGHVMAAKRDSLDRLNGGHIMASKRDSPVDSRPWSSAHVSLLLMRQPTDGGITVDRLGPDSSSSAVPEHHRRLSSRQLPRYVQLHRWTDLVESDGGREYGLDDNDNSLNGNDASASAASAADDNECGGGLDCGRSVRWSSSV